MSRCISAKRSLGPEWKWFLWGSKIPSSLWGTESEPQLPSDMQHGLHTWLPCGPGTLSGRDFCRSPRRTRGGMLRSEFQAKQSRAQNICCSSKHAKCSEKNQSSSEHFSSGSFANSASIKHTTSYQMGNFEREIKLCNLKVQSNECLRRVGGPWGNWASIELSGVSY